MKRPLSYQIFEMAYQMALNNVGFSVEAIRPLPFSSHGLIYASPRLY